ncbi:MAG: PIN domain-containing protein [Isosphaeraceae bacterium]
MSVVFADSFDFIALSNPSDGHHAAAVRAAESLTSRLLTTHYVLIEVADALSAPRFRADVAQFLRQLALDPGTEIIGPDIPLFERGLDLYAQRPDKAWFLTDCISFVVMTERGLTEALTGDNHFEQAGFHALLR